MLKTIKHLKNIKMTNEINYNYLLNIFKESDYNYSLIKNHYGDKTTKRSGVKLINHIDEGIKILILLGASHCAIQAYCLHPIVQDDESYQKLFNSNEINLIPQVSLTLAIEYRHAANSFLSTMPKENLKMSIFGHVKQMLIADKIQNRKDFEIYHKNTHPRTKELTEYFNQWMKILDISEEKYQSILEKVKNYE